MPERRLTTTAVVSGVVLLAWAAALGAMLAHRSAPYDDAFITLRYARNFAEGHGFVYNPGETLFGASSPFYGLVLGLLARMTRIDPLIFANWISALSLAVTSWYAFRLIEVDFGFFAAAVAAVSVAFNPFLISTWGGEWLVAIAAMAAAFYCYRTAAMVTTAVALSLAVLLRAEAILGALLIVGHAVMTGRPRVVRALIVSAAIGSLWAGVSWVVIGRVIPTTLGTKITLGQSGWFTPFLTGVRTLAGQYLSDSRLLVIPLLAWPGAFYALMKQRTIWSLIGLWLIAHVTFYAALQLAFYHWYLVPIAFGLSLAVGPGLAAIRAYVPLVVPSAFAATSLSTAAMLAFSALLITGELRSTRYWIRIKPDPREELYGRVGSWLADHTPPESSVAYVEVGRIGYYSRRPIVDQMGLLTPGVADRVAQSDFGWPIYHYQPDYYLVNSLFGWVNALRDEPWFLGVYRPVSSFTPVDGTMTLTVFEKQPGAEFPVPRDIEPIQARADRVIGEMIAGHSHSQTFSASRNRLQSVATRLATYARVNHGSMRFTVEQIEPLRLVHQEQFEMADVKDNEWRVFQFPPVEDSAGRPFRFTLEPLNGSPGNALTIWYSSRNLYKAGQYFVDGQPVSGDLTLRVEYAADRLSGAQ
jgi:hypothetical protein